MHCPQSSLSVSSTQHTPPHKSLITPSLTHSSPCHQSPPLTLLFITLTAGCLPSALIHPLWSAGWLLGAIYPTYMFPGLYQLTVNSSFMICRGKRPYLLTCKVSRYCLLALHDLSNNGHISQIDLG